MKIPGIIAAVREKGVTVPVVVRLEGTNVEKGKELRRKRPGRLSPRMI